MTTSPHTKENTTFLIFHQGHAASSPTVSTSLAKVAQGIPNDPKAVEEKSQEGGQEETKHREAGEAGDAGEKEADTQGDEVSAQHASRVGLRERCGIKSIL